ncbi:DUF3833 domain-containing protein [Ferrimonas pelagia]|uniref:DUF3833 domain-containing protein n=1 Tax=Ferrimonas pelagia TaxID=1177826 RepID=A0ABP9FCL9_9GAMM
MKVWLRNVMLTLSLGLLLSCSASLEDYQDTTPAFDLFGFFEGQSTAWGMLQDRSGKQTRRFEVALVGTVTADTLVLAEDFVFDDGETQQRTWTIVRQADGSYRGTAPDVIGQAVGRVAGNALHWQYTLRIPVGDTSYDITLNDWMYRQDSHRLFNLARLSKFGVEVGRITLFFEKP